MCVCVSFLYVHEVLLNLTCVMWTLHALDTCLCLNMYVFIPVFRGDELVHVDVNCPDDNLNMLDKYVVGRTPHTNISNIYKLINMNKTNTYLILHWGETCPFCLKCSNLATMDLNLQSSGFVPPSRRTRSTSTHSFSISTWNLLKSGPETLWRELLPERAGNGGWKWFFFKFYSCFPVNSKCPAPEIFFRERVGRLQIMKIIEKKKETRKKKHQISKTERN